WVGGGEGEKARGDSIGGCAAGGRLGDSVPRRRRRARRRRVTRAHRDVASGFSLGPRVSAPYDEREPPPTRGVLCLMGLIERLTEGVSKALAADGLSAASDVGVGRTRQSEHGDYATNAAITLARVAKRPPRQIAEAIVKHFPPMAEVSRLEIAGPGFINVFLAPTWVADALREILEAGAGYGRGTD